MFHHVLAPMECEICTQFECQEQKKNRTYYYVCKSIYLSNIFIYRIFQLMAINRDFYIYYSAAQFRRRLIEPHTLNIFILNKDSIIFFFTLLFRMNEWE